TTQLALREATRKDMKNDSVIDAGTYNIFTGTGSLGSLNTFLKREQALLAFILCDTNSSKHCLPSLLKECQSLRSADVIRLPAGERHKSLTSCEKIWARMLKRAAGKDALLINLGGGVISDLGAFSASVYKRGIPYINVP